MPTASMLSNILHLQLRGDFLTVKTKRKIPDVSISTKEQIGLTAVVGHLTPEEQETEIERQRKLAMKKARKWKEKKQRRQQIKSATARE
jgi:hypothetical protein